MIDDTVRTAIRQTAAQISQADLAPLELDQKPQFAGYQRSTHRSTHRSGQPSGQRGIARPLIALSAAAAMLALVVGVVAAGSALRHAGPAAPQQPGAPRYFVALTASPTKAAVETSHAVIVDSLTGKVLSSVTPPKPFGDFAEVAAAADDRTFVLAAQTGTEGPHWLSKLFVLRFDPFTKTSSLRPLGFTFPANFRGRKTSWIGQGLALTPDGTKLAIAASPYAKAIVTRVWTYSMAKGTTRSWQGAGEIGLNEYDSRAISWSSDDRTLSYMWSTGPSGTDSVQLLDTSARQGYLVSHSRELIRMSDADFEPWFHADLTPDGSKLVSAVVAKVPTIDVLPSSTGHPIKSLRFNLPIHHRLVDVLWTNSAASTMIVSEVDKLDAPTVLLLRGHKLTKITGAEPFASSDPTW